MSSSLDYWLQREEEALQHYITDEKEYDRQIERIYADMLDSVQAQIDAFYGKYAKQSNITLAEAKKRIRELDIAAYERKAKKYVRTKDFSAKANEEMLLYNATMKINRLEMLKANIGLETVSGFNELEKLMGEALEGRTMEELKRQAGILGDSIKNNAQLAHSIVNASYKNATFSDRIWMYQDQMRNDLGKLLQVGMIQGKNPRVLAKELRQYWYGNDPKTKKGAVYCMERLMRTEMARVQTDAQMKSFERNDIDEYTFLANHSCCDHCQALHGKHFKVADMVIAENAPPLHPHCRCSTAAYLDRTKYNEWLDHLSNGGTMTLKEYKKKNENLAEKKKNSIMTSKQAKISVLDKQFGKKVGRHASDFGLDPSSGKDREEFYRIITEIIDNATEQRIGSWRGQSEEVVFHIHKDDVVITNQQNEFISILKGGVNNARIKNARKRKI